MIKLRELIVVATLVLFWGCGGGPENATVEQFFRAAQSDDQTTIASMSAVSPPGQIQSWSVVEVSSRTTEPYELPELLEQLEEAEEEREAILKKGREYLEEHVELDEIIPKLQEDPDYEFSGQMGEIQDEWMEIVEERKEKERRYQDIKRSVDRATRLVRKSVMNRGLNVEQLDGEVAETTMRWNLQPQGHDEPLPFDITLQRYDLQNPQTNRTEPARWVIVEIEGASPEARAAAEEARKPPVAAGGVAPSQPSEAAGGEPAAAPAPSPEAAETAEAAPAPSPAESRESSRSSTGYRPKELRGVARVQVAAPETRVEGDQVISTIRVRNTSRDWITRFTATEYWYDEQGTATRGGSRTYDERFMPGEVIELELRTDRNPNFYQNQFEFSHANGEVEATMVQSLPSS